MVELLKMFRKTVARNSTRLSGEKGMDRGIFWEEEAGSSVFGEIRLNGHVVIACPSHRGKSGIGLMMGYRISERLLSSRSKGHRVSLRGLLLF